MKYVNDTVQDRRLLELLHHATDPPSDWRHHMTYDTSQATHLDLEYHCNVL